jgi:hypothetical protein
MADTELKVRVRRTPFMLLHGRYVVEAWEDMGILVIGRYCWRRKVTCWRLKTALRWRAYLAEETIIRNERR